jgi:hypothetical protein
VVDDPNCLVDSGMSAQVELGEIAVGSWREININSLIRTVAVGLGAGALALATAVGTGQPSAPPASSGGQHPHSCNDSTPLDAVAPAACPGPSPVVHE